MMNCKKYVKYIALTIFQKMRLLEAFYVMIVSISHNFVNNTNSTIFKRNSLNLNWQERLHDEQQVNVGTLSVQSNDCHSSEQILLTSYDIDMLMKTRKTYKKSHNWVPEHKFLKNLNFLSLKEILHKAPIYILCIDETKFDETFPDAQFMMKNYQFLPFRTDRNKKGGRKMIFIGKELLAKRLEDFETKSTETICIELLMSKKKWYVIFTYRLPKCNKKVLFQELSKTVSSVYDNILVAGDLNIDVSRSKRLNDNHLSEMIDTFKVTNLVKTPTCFKTARGNLVRDVTHK